ncbi:hypothetical protein TRVL_00023 [Trypanosoma vivax]|nr:hypothetical protein TRVL_00023 [Trypanosoma vivax]
MCLPFSPCDVEENIMIGADCSEGNESPQMLQSRCLAFAFATGKKTGFGTLREAGDVSLETRPRQWLVLDLSILITVSSVLMLVFKLWEQLFAQSSGAQVEVPVHARSQLTGYVIIGGSNAEQYQSNA